MGAEEEWLLSPLEGDGAVDGSEGDDLFGLKETSLEGEKRFSGSVSREDSVGSNELGHGADGLDFSEPST